MIDSGISAQELSEKLDELLSDEMRSEVVFDAYRSVCLSKSKSIGPRVIALLTAELVIANSIAGEPEEFIFSAAEELLDTELEEAATFVLSHHAQKNNGEKSRSIINSNESITVQLAQETLDSNWINGHNQKIGPLDLARDIGKWAAKLNQLGLLSTDLTERQWRYEEDSERHIDQPGIAREITWSLTLNKEALKLATLIRRATPIPQL